jgi:signal transduction histidine kinase
LAVLRRDQAEPPRDPAPGLGDLDNLARVFSETGLKVDVAVTGVSPVPESVALAVYRIVQEALTNSLRHSGAHHANVQVTLRHEFLTLAVSDDGNGDPVAIEAGRGITGMRERAGLHDGTLTIDRSQEGGLEVRADLKWDGTP